MSAYTQNGQTASENATSGRAKETWSQAEPFPIAADLSKLKSAVTIACQRKTQLEAALVYAQFGIPVIPCNWKPEPAPEICTGR